MGESLIHIKLEPVESIETRIGILNTERELINLLKRIKRYHIIRSTELQLKLMLQKRIKEIKLNIIKLEQILPKIRIPEILKREEEEVKKESSGKKVKKEEYDKNIENQLREIQEKLRKLG